MLVIVHQIFYFVGEPILEALQGRQSFLLCCYENCRGAGLSSCMFVRTFHAFIFSQGMLHMLHWIPVRLKGTFQMVISRCLFHHRMLLLFFTWHSRCWTSLICLLKHCFHLVMKLEILKGQENHGKFYLLVIKLGHQSLCLGSWYMFYSIAPSNFFFFF